MPDPTSASVPNPALGWLQTLLRQVQAAQAAIPNINQPTASIGPGPAWTGSKALDTHDQTLQPAAKPFSDALNGITEDVQNAINRTPSTVTAAEAKMMNLNRPDY